MAVLRPQLVLWAFLALTGVRPAAPVVSNAYLPFHKAIKATAILGLREQPSVLPANKQAIAENVVQKIKTLVDGTINKPMAHFEQGFACIVWEPRVPDGYGNAVSFGEMGEKKFANYWRVASRGGAVFSRCSGQAGWPDWRRVEVGELGWPCPTGAAVQVAGPGPDPTVQLSCVVSYFSLHVQHRFDATLILGTFKMALDTSTSKLVEPRLHEARDPSMVDLTELAIRFSDVAADIGKGLANNHNFPYKVKAAVFAVVTGPHIEERPGATVSKRPVLHSDQIGLVDDYGSVTIDYREIPTYDASLDPAYLFAFNAAPVPL